MSASERETLLRRWEPLDTKAIVIDVATKGKYINLAISFMAKRLSISVDQAKEKFQCEVNEYVHRLLENGQVFRAEHVLKNLDRIPKYMFYEFVTNKCDLTTTTDSRALQPGSSKEDIIMNYLRKNDANFEDERVRLDIELQMLASIVVDTFLRTKYEKELPTPNLESLYKCSDAFRRTIECDCLFVARHTFVIPILQKFDVLAYLLNERKYILLIKWLNAVRPGGQEVADHLNSNSSDLFETALFQMFSKWNLDDDMMMVLNEQDAALSNCVKDVLARHGRFVESEKGNRQIMLSRVFATESWKQNVELLSDKATIKDLATNVIIKNGFLSLLIEPFVDKELLQELLESHPNEKNTIELCMELKECDPNDILGMSTAVSKFFLKNDPNYFEKKPFVYLKELLLQNPSISSVVTSPHTKHILSRIPVVDTFLKKLSTSTTQHDQTSTLQSLVLQFKNIDLKQISNEAGNEPLNFSNPTLISRYGQPERLSYLHYVKQFRSAFAVYVFLVEQLQQFGQITPGQISYACSCVADFALAHYDEVELVIHCISFIEMLGMNSVAIRAHINCIRVVKAARPDLELASIGDGELLAVMEQVHMENGTTDLEALRVVHDARSLKLPESFLKQKMKKGDWFQFMLFAMYYDYSLDTVLDVLNSTCDGFDGEAQIALNMARAFKYDVGPERIRRNSSLTYREHRKKHLAKLDVNSVRLCLFWVEPEISRFRSVFTDHNILLIRRWQVVRQCLHLSALAKRQLSLS